MCRYTLEFIAMPRAITIEIVAPLVAVGLALLSAGNAQAQDGGGRMDDWRGVYGGIHAGGGVGDANSANTSGLLAGAQAGINFQSDQVVLGVEGDVTGSSVDHKSFATKYRQKWIASARARGGIAMDRVLVYGTAGVAYSGNEFKDASGKSDSSQAGLVVGAGAEVKVSQRVSLRGEYLHYNFGSATHSSVIGPVSISPTTNVLRGGLNLRF
jgi:outer membrane immunogenic protein